MSGVDAGVRNFRFNVTAESRGRVQVARLYGLTDDTGVRDMLSFMMARDTMHQNQWLAAIEELEADGLGAPLPDTFPTEQQHNEVAYQYWSCSEGDDAKAGRWASGPSRNGLGEFEYLKEPKPMGPKVEETSEVDPRLHGTPKLPKEPTPS